MKNRFIILTLAPIIFSGCISVKTKSAKVIDSEVEGLEYQCAGLSNYTDKNGTATCKHMPLAFKIGEIKLGVIYKMPKDGIILPQDIAKVSRDKIYDKNVIKITTILQSLDEDHNPNNGIKITKEVRDKLSKQFIDIKKESLVDIKDLIESELGDINFTTAKSSITHLHKSMRKYNIKSTPKLDENRLLELD